MFLPDPQVARSAVLRVFNHAQIFLLLGAAITTIGILAGLLLALRRRFDSLLFWFSLFAILYGMRLVMNYQLLWALGLRPLLLQRIVVAVGFLVPIPAFFFFSALGVMERWSKTLSWIVCPSLLSLSVAVLCFGRIQTLQTINNSIVVVALIVVSLSLLWTREKSKELSLIRFGLFFFVACAIYDNITGLFGHYYNIEPFSFVVCLGCLGVAAGRYTLAKENQLTLIQKELDIAQNIQRSILPFSFPTSGSFRIAARYLPMTAVAGDFFDFVVKDEHKAALLIADVSGHGVPAALIASMVKLAINTQSAHADRPADVLHGMNNILCGNTQGQFVTAGYVYLDASSRTLSYAGAAHPPMMHLRQGKVTEIAENGLMLGAFDFARYATVTHSLEPGDRVVLYTDGLLEARNAQGEEFGPSRLQAVVSSTANMAAMEAADCVVAAVKDWCISQDDDLTVLVCDCSVA